MVVVPVSMPGEQIAVYAIYRDITQRKQAEELQTEFLKRVLSAQEEERKRIARELHDETGQSLMSLLVGLRTIDDAPTLKDSQAQAAHLRTVTSQAMKEVQRLAHGLRPALLDDLGLEVALKRYADDFTRAHGIPVAVDAIGLDAQRLPAHIETALFRIAQEALTNAAKHAAAKHVSLLLNRHSSDIQMIVEDDGSGFEERAGPNTPAPSVHLGLYGMRERVSMLGGSISIESGVEGTTIPVKIPLEKAAA
jgi:signal transduction histidine kinase